MKRLFAYILVAAMLLVLPLAAGAGTVEQRFAAAQAEKAAAPNDTLEARRTFRQAADEFAAIADGGTASANLYVNAGNAYHFAGDDPRALLWYLRARQLANTQEIREGLATLRRICKAQQWTPDRPSIWRVLMFWHYDQGRWTKQAVMLALYPAGCLLLIAAFVVKKRRLCVRMGLALVIVGGLMGASDAVAALAGGEQWAVLLSPAKGYAGDGRMYSVLVPALSAGQEVKVVDARPDWTQVQLPGGERCWVPQSDCEAVDLRQRPTAGRKGLGS